MNGMQARLAVLAGFRATAVYGRASIADIVDATALPLTTVHLGVQLLRAEGILSGSGVETGDERIRAAAIREGWNGDYYTDLIGYVSLRN